MMMLRQGIIGIFLLVQQVHQCTSFTAISTSIPSVIATTQIRPPTASLTGSSVYHRSHRPFVKATTKVITTCIKAAAQSTTDAQLHDPSHDPHIFVLSYDGVVADTTNWRVKLAINVALKTWPHLQQYYDCNHSTDDWLVNKVSALIPITLSSKNSAEGGDGTMGCDSVLLTRLLLEEQLLDEGRSNGCGGKYGSKFHPSSSSNKKSSSGGGSSNGSRPLTVGEIAANWNGGACLRDTVRIRYNIDRKDPIPVIREGIRDYLLKRSSSDDDEDCVPDLHPSIIDAFLDCTSPVFIMMGDESHVPMAILSLTRHGIPVESMILDDDDGDDDEDSRLDMHPGITILSSSSQGGRGETRRQNEGILRYILMSANKGSSVHMVHSDVSALQRSKIFFGDNRPMMRTDMFGKSGLLQKTATTGEDSGTDNNTDIYLKLSLSKWNSGLQQQNDAIMDPWLNVIDDSEFVETLSARIVTR